MTEAERETSLPIPGRGASAPRPGVKPWLQLLAGIVLILLFIFGGGSLAKRIPGARHFAQVVDERGMRVTAIYYTDFEEPAEASESIRDSLDYVPGRKP